jgi:uncharacterized Rossmann fold enzyme
MDRWLPIYHDICMDFGFSEIDDQESALLLSSLAGRRSRPSLESALRQGVPSSAVLCGGGDTLASDMKSLAWHGLVIAADGATSTLVAMDIRPDIIVTDLDGVVEDQIRVNAEGGVAFVHAHGDNKEAIRQYVPQFIGKIVCTCQCPPVEGVLNFGGFTDGDRAACIAAAIGVRTIRLAGFDFKNPSSKSGKSSEAKARKLVWAKRILSMLADEGVDIGPPLPI